MNICYDTFYRWSSSTLRFIYVHFQRKNSTLKIYTQYSCNWPCIVSTATTCPSSPWRVTWVEFSCMTSSTTSFFKAGYSFRIGEEITKQLSIVVSAADRFKLTSGTGGMQGSKFKRLISFDKAMNHTKLKTSTTRISERSHRWVCAEDGIKKIRFSYGIISLSSSSIILLGN